MHYAALDAYCMIPLVEKLLELSKAKENFDIKQHIKPEILSMQQE